MSESPDRIAPMKYGVEWVDDIIGRFSFHPPTSLVMVSRNPRISQLIRSRIIIEERSDS